MADPLSIAASVAGLIALSQEVHKQISLFIASVKNAEKNILRLRSEIINLYGMVQSIRAIQDLDEESLTIVQPLRQAIELCISVLNDISTRLLQDPDFSAVSRFKNLKQKLTWPFKEKDTLHHLKELERCKSILCLHLQVYGLEMLTKIDEGQQNMLVQVRKGVQDMISIKEGAELRLLVAGDDRELLDRFSKLPIDSQQTFLTIKRTEMRAFVEEEELKLLSPFSSLINIDRLAIIDKDSFPGTCDWIMSTPQFMDWKQGSSRGIWLLGMAGEGKTTIATHVFKQLRNTSSPEEAVIRYACAYNNTATKSSLDILISLAMQLTEQSRSSLQKCQRFIRNHTINGRLHVTVEDVQDLIIETTFDYTRVYIIIDALDAFSGEPASLEPVLELIRMSKRIKMFTTSRNSLRLLIPLPLLPRGGETGFRIIHVSSKLSSELIYRYIKVQVRARLPQLSLKEQDLLRNKMKNFDNICFLFAKLKFRRFVSITSIRETLERLNSGLLSIEEMLQDLVKCIYNARGGKHAVRLLRYVHACVTVSNTKAMSDIHAEILAQKANGIIRIDNDSNLRFNHVVFVDFIAHAAPDFIDIWEASSR